MEQRAAIITFRRYQESRKRLLERSIFLFKKTYKFIFVESHPSLPRVVPVQELPQRDIPNFSSRYRLHAPHSFFRRAFALTGLGCREGTVRGIRIQDGLEILDCWEDHQVLRSSPLRHMYASSWYMRAFNTGDLLSVYRSNSTGNYIQRTFRRTIGWS